MRPVPSLDEYYLGLAFAASSRSKDPIRQVGCVIVAEDPSSRMISGYNGFPQGIVDSPDRWRDGVKKQRVIHAELNAICRAAKGGTSIAGATAYVTLAPCEPCSLLLIAAGIRRVVWCKKTTDEWLEAEPDKTHSRKAAFARTLRNYVEAGIRAAGR